MSTTIIPAQTIVTCDCCGNQCNNLNRRKEASFILKQHALDYQGSACADGSVKRDLCDSCATVIGKAVNEACEKVRATAIDAAMQAAQGQADKGGV